MDALKDMDAVIVAVAHEDFTAFTAKDIAGFFDPKHSTKVFLDIKGIYNKNDFTKPEFDYWRL
jgi:UDP-N-acetyl-D-galactosamine dehydrogenase